MSANQDFAIFSGATIPGIKMNSLVYFANEHLPESGNP
jgi:hypothetical protein